MSSTTYTAFCEFVERHALSPLTKEQRTRQGLKPWHSGVAAAIFWVSIGCPTIM